VTESVSPHPVEPATEPPVEETPLPPPEPGGATAALIVGLIAALALGLTLLTWALSLMFMLGLFFFMLFGLLVGACMFRAGRRSRPMSRRIVRGVTAVVAIAGWLTAVGKECYDFPKDFVAAVMQQRGGRSAKVHIPKGGYDRVQSEVRDFLGPYLTEHYPPGGWTGYVRYTLANEPIKLDIPSQGRVIDVPARVAPWVWITRVALALPLFFLTMYSVTAGLTGPPTAAEKRRHY
jgi:hypothetical protein